MKIQLNHVLLESFQNPIYLHLIFFFLILHSIVLFCYHILLCINKNIFYSKDHEFYRYFIAVWQPFWVTHLEFRFSYCSDWFVISYSKNLQIPSCTKKYIVKMFFWVVLLTFYGNMAAILDQTSWIHVNFWIQNFILLKFISLYTKWSSY